MPLAGHDKAPTLRVSAVGGTVCRTPLRQTMIACARQGPLGHAFVALRRGAFKRGDAACAGDAVQASYQPSRSSVPSFPFCPLSRPCMTQKFRKFTTTCTINKMYYHWYNYYYEVVLVSTTEKTDTRSRHFVRLCLPPRRHFCRIMVSTSIINPALIIIIIN